MEGPFASLTQPVVTSNSVETWETLTFDRVTAVSKGVNASHFG